MKLNIPNTLTLFRIVLIPILVILFYWHFPGSRIICACIFALACVTDWFDGYLARVTHQESAFGAFLDPVADKLIVAVALVLVVEQHHVAFVSIPALVIIGREIVISALREWMAELGKRAQISVSYIGKVKTTAQMGAITFLLAYKTGKWDILDYLGILLIYIAAILTLWSMILYLKAAWPHLTSEN